MPTDVSSSMQGIGSIKLLVQNEAVLIDPMLSVEPRFAAHIPHLYHLGGYQYDAPQ